MKFRITFLLLFISSAGVFSQVPAMESFVDLDPGVGQGMPYAVIQNGNQYEANISMSTNSLPIGFHRIYCRVKDDNLHWGLAANKLIYIYSADSPVPVEERPPLSSGEYFTDTDPGPGNATPFSIVPNANYFEFSQNIPIPGLTAGFHRIYFRFKDIAGQWGMAQSSLIFVYDTQPFPTVTEQSDLAYMEYFFDTDPGPGAGNMVALSPHASFFEFSGGINTSGLATGFHYLYARFRSETGTWGLESHILIYIYDASPPSPITQQPEPAAFEYFFDADLGVGNGIALSGIANADSLVSSGSLTTSSLSAGTHTLNIRVKDITGHWSIYCTRVFHICNSIPQPAFQANDVCLGNTSYFQDMSSFTTPETLYSWDFDGDSTADSFDHGNSSFLYTAAGVYTVHLTLTEPNGCENSLSQTYTVHALPQAAGFIVGPANICQGQSMVTYSIDPITNATAYSWIIPAGCSGSSVTDSVQVDFSTNAGSGTISVYATNQCGQGAASSLFISSQSLPGATGEIYGPSMVCQGQQGVMYSVSPATNATEYTWILPTGVTGLGNDQSILLTFGNNAQSCEISVSGTNSCGVGPSSNYLIELNPLPDDAGTIAGDFLICLPQANETYTVPPINNASLYVWTVPAGALGSSNTNQIVLDWTNAQSGDLMVYAINSCGPGNSSSVLISVNQVPPVPTISYSGGILSAPPGYSYQWYNSAGLIPGAVFQQFVPADDDNYYVIISTNGCFSANSNIIHVVISGIETTNLISGISVYPVPFTDALTIDIKDNQPYELTLFNMLSHRVYSNRETAKSTINTKNLLPGIYILKITSGNDDAYYKVIKK